MMFLNPYRDVGGSTPLLLDLYPDAQFAYSLQYLRTGVLRVIRVQRSSDNTQRDFKPIEITDGTLVNWVGIGNNGFMKIWYDQTDNSIDLNYLNLTNKIVDDGVLLTDNGMPYVNYTGNETIYDQSLSNNPQLNSDKGTLFTIYNSNDNNPGVILTSNSNTWLGANQPNNTTIPQQNSGNIIYYKNGSLITPTNRETLYNNIVKNTDVLLSALNIGINKNSLWLSRAYPWIYTVNVASASNKAKEIVVYNSDQTTNKAGIEANIKSRYGIV